MRRRAALHEGTTPNPSTKNFLSIALNDAGRHQSEQLLNISKVFADGDAVEGAFFKKTARAATNDRMTLVAPPISRWRGSLVPRTASLDHGKKTPHCPGLEPARTTNLVASERNRML